MFLEIKADVEIAFYGSDGKILDAKEILKDHKAIKDEIDHFINDNNGTNVNYAKKVTWDWEQEYEPDHHGPLTLADIAESFLENGYLSPEVLEPAGFGKVTFVGKRSKIIVEIRP